MSLPIRSVAQWPSRPSDQRWWCHSAPAPPHFTPWWPPKRKSRDAGDLVTPVRSHEVLPAREWCVCTGNNSAQGVPYLHPQGSGSVSPEDKGGRWTALPLSCDDTLKGLPPATSGDAAELPKLQHAGAWLKSRQQVRRGQGWLLSDQVTEWPAWATGLQESRTQSGAEAAVTAANAASRGNPELSPTLAVLSAGPPFS